MKAIVPREIELLQKTQASRQVPREENEMQMSQGQISVIASVSTQNHQ